MENTPPSAYRVNTAMQRFTCDLYYHFGALLAPVSVGIITGKHYAKNSITKLNDRSDNGTCDLSTRNCNKTEEPSEKGNWLNITIVRKKR